MGEFVYEFELGKAADVIVKIIQSKARRNFVITADSRSDERVVNAPARAIYTAAGVSRW